MHELIPSMLTLLNPVHLGYVALGVSLGIIVGAIPGLSGTMLIALTLPLTFYMKSVVAVELLVSMYVGSVSGGLISATLLRIPGTPASIVTTFDAYPMAMKGKPGRAVGIGIISSFIGGLISWIFLVLLSPPLSALALKFGPFELFSMVLMALVLIASIGGGSFIKGIVSGFLGMLVACAGIDPVTSQLRLTFGSMQMVSGLNLIPILIGMFGISQILNDAIHVEHKIERVPLKLSGVFLSLRELKEHTANFVRSSVIGTWVGLLPGIGANIGSIMSYSAAKNASKTPERFGTGIEDGIIASETANNATIGGAFVPMLSLGIPGSIITAVLMGALTLHDVTPGPLLFKNNPDVVYSIIATVFVANLIMFFLMIGATFIVGRLVDIPKANLIPIILVFCVIGTFALNNRIFDVWLMFIFGLVGFALEKVKVPLAPFVIGLILSPIAEINLRSGLMLSAGSFLPLLTRPISAIFVCIAIGTLVWSLYQTVRGSARKQ
jgi:putative tricarboxylic transport membrane protein